MHLPARHCAGNAALCPGSRLVCLERPESGLPWRRTKLLGSAVHGRPVLVGELTLPLRALSSPPPRLIEAAAFRHLRCWTASSRLRCTSRARAARECGISAATLLSATFLSATFLSATFLSATFLSATVLSSRDCTCLSPAFTRPCLDRLQKPYTPAAAAQAHCPGLQRRAGRSGQA